MEKENEFKNKVKTLAVKLGIIDEVKNSKFEEVVLSDETKIIIEPAVEVKATVMIDVEGELQAVPDETYELADKRKIVVVGGKIESLEEVTEDEEGVVEEMSTEEKITVEDVQKMLDALGFDFSKKIAKVENDFKAYKKNVELETLENNKAIVEAFKSVGDKPAEEVKKKKNGFSFKQENKLEEILKNKLKTKK